MLRPLRPALTLLRYCASIRRIKRRVEYCGYPDSGELTISHDTEDELGRWIGERSVGAPAQTTCR